MSVRLRPNPPVAPLAQWQSADLLSPEIAVQVRGGVSACTPTWQRIALRRHSVGVRIAAGTPPYDFARYCCRSARNRRIKPLIAACGICYWLPRHSAGVSSCLAAFAPARAVQIPRVCRIFSGKLLRYVQSSTQGERDDGSSDHTAYLLAFVPSVGGGRCQRTCADLCPRRR